MANKLDQVPRVQCHLGYFPGGRDRATGDGTNQRGKLDRRDPPESTAGSRLCFRSARIDLSREEKTEDIGTLRRMGRFGCVSSVICSEAVAPRTKRETKALKRSDRSAPISAKSHRPFVRRSPRPGRKKHTSAKELTAGAYRRRRHFVLPPRTYPRRTRESDERETFRGSRHFRGVATSILPALLNAQKEMTNAGKKSARSTIGARSIRMFPAGVVPASGKSTSATNSAEVPPREGRLCTMSGSIFSGGARSAVEIYWTERRPFSKVACAFAQPESSFRAAKAPIMADKSDEGAFRRRRRGYLLCGHDQSGGRKKQPARETRTTRRLG